MYQHTVCKDELEIREEFTRLDLDRNGFITKGEESTIIQRDKYE